MDLLVGGIISGVALGLLYGLLAFAIVLLFKSTGVANFSQGQIGTFCTFLVFELMRAAGVSFGVAVAIGCVLAFVSGIACYWLFLRPNEGADHVNLTIRTLGIYLLLFAIVDLGWSKGQPFAFPSLFPQGGVTIADTAISWLTVETIGVAVLLAVLTWWFFRRTDKGLMFAAVAERPEIAKLLGVRTRRLTATAWGGAATVALIVGLLVAPRTLLSSDMMDLYLLFAFTAAIVGGLTSLPGALVGGLLVGVLENVVTIYVNSDVAVLGVFVLLLVVLLVRPEGLFGSSVAERL
jgi:branched-chain amino acid transport system permease protein